MQLSQEAGRLDILPRYGYIAIRRLPEKCNLTAIQLERRLTYMLYSELCTFSQQMLKE